MNFLHSILNFKFEILNLRSKRGFTLIELMVAIAIVAILATVGMVVYASAQKSGRVSKRLQDLKAIQTALELFKTTKGFYPSVTTAGTFVCVDALSANNSLAPNFLPVVPRDPIQTTVSGANCYEYTSNGTGATPQGTEYKVRSRVPTSEMTWEDLNQQPTMINPAADGNTGNGCTVDLMTANVTNQGWAFFTPAATTCAY